MLTDERQRIVARHVKDYGSVSTSSLAQMFHVSLETIRRDLMALEDRGLVQRVYGGAVLPGRQMSVEMPYLARVSEHAEAKAASARAAVSMLSNDSLVFLDVGTTCELIARQMVHRFHGTVVTQSILVAKELHDAPGVKVIMAPGVLNGAEWYVTGNLPAAFISDFNFATALISCGGVDVTGGVTDFTFEDVRAKQLAAQHATAAYVVADSSKHGVLAGYSVMSWESCSGLITDKRPSTALASALSRAGCRLVVAEELEVDSA